MAQLWAFAIFILYLLGTIALLVFCAWLYPHRARFGSAGTAILSASGTMAVWGIAVMSAGWNNPGTLILLSLSYLAWFVALYGMFQNDGRHESVRPIRPVIITLCLVEATQLALLVAEARFHALPVSPGALVSISATLRLLCDVGALVLVHNLYIGASPGGRLTLRWPAAALAAMWLYDLNLYTVAYLGEAMPETLGVLRGLLMPVMAILLGLGATKSRAEIRLRASRTVAFQSFSLLVIGIYLIGMVLVAQALSYMDSEPARLIQIGFVVAASAVALLVLPSPKLRSWAKVVLAKHLFQHRYDYRAEWLRFTETIARGGEQVMPLHQRVIQAVADITDSPAGLLLTPSEDGGLELDASWQWPAAEVPAEALSPEAVHFFVREKFIVELDRIRKGRDVRGETSHVPSWLIEQRDAWAMVPLLHYQRLVGMVVLARPAAVRRLDWEDFDLLRVVGQQLASYLAEQAGQEALGEAHRFDEFNRRIAFVMHDIKNLASQLSLLARNAEKHADKPEFRADMLVTLRNSSDKLNALLSRLGRYGAGAPDKLERVDAGQRVAHIVKRYEAQHPVHLINRQHCEVLVDSEGFEQALVHLVQNAIEASEPNSPVMLSVSSEGLYCRIEIVDAGSGMSPEFVRTRLFKPFNSSKPGGFGIGAFEARELVRAMRGQLKVESREGLGTRFIIRLPLAATTRLASEFPDSGNTDNAEVA